ncbi:MAG: type II secretion system minor pseudopilin GspI [Nitrospinota bacterium]
MAGQRRRAPERRPSGCRPSGFTLLELTVALAIVSAVAAAALRLQHQSFGASLRAQRLTDAVLLAQEKLVEAELSPASPAGGRVRGAGGEELSWEVVVEPTAHPGVRAVRVRVSSERESVPVLEVVTYVARREPIP